MTLKNHKAVYSEHYVKVNLNLKCVQSPLIEPLC